MVRTSFPLAPMGPGIRALSLVLVLLGVGFVVLSRVDARVAWLPAALLLGLAASVWLFFRPARFRLERGVLVLEYPVRAKRIALGGLAAAELITSAGFKARFRWALRVGVGGLFGGFGWLRTAHGWVEMDISRTDGMVLLTFTGRSPMLLTPEDPEVFIEAVLQAARAG